MYILRPGVLEALEVRSLVQLLSLMGAPPIPVDRIPDEGVRQRIVSEDMSHPPKVLVVGSVEDVVDPPSCAQFTRESLTGHHLETMTLREGGVADVLWGSMIFRGGSKKFENGFVKQN